MTEPIAFRAVKFGGFCKEDVLAYINKLNARNAELEEQIKSLQEKLNSLSRVTNLVK